MPDLDAPENQKYRRQFAANCARVGQTEEEYIAMMRLEEGLDVAPTPSTEEADAVPDDHVPDLPRPPRRPHGRSAAQRKNDQQPG